MTYAASCFQTGVDPRTNVQINLAYKEGLLFIFGTLRDLISKEKFIKD